MNRPAATVEPVDAHGDARGILVEPLAAADIAAQRNAHLVVTRPGGVRGNHFHRGGTETAVVLGPALVRLRDADGVRDVTVPESEAYRFVFPPGVSHAYGAIGVEPLVLIAFSTQPHDPANPDVFPDRLLDPGELASRFGGG